MPEKEYLPILDEKFNVIGKEERSKFHNNPEVKLLHPVVHLHLFNRKNELFLQFRPMDKLIQPGKWDTAVGGHINFGESIEDSLSRETEEEIGIIPINPVKIQSYIWETEVERELVHVFILRGDETPVINPEELAGGKFWNLNELKENMNSGIFTPNFVHEFNLLCKKGIID